MSTASVSAFQPLHPQRHPLRWHLCLQPWHQCLRQQPQQTPVQPFVRFNAVNRFLFSCNRQFSHLFLFVSVYGPIVEILDRTPEFETLTALIRAARIEDILSESSLTIFAPTNTAFDELSTELIQTLLINNELLQFILFGHVVPRTEVPLSDLKCQGGPLSSLSMANNAETTISCGSGLTGNFESSIVTFISGADQIGIPPKVIEGDIKACNGIIHRIDGVIMSDVAAPTNPPVHKRIDFGSRSRQQSYRTTRGLLRK